MSTRGLLSFRINGLDYVTCDHCVGSPKAQAGWIGRFARQHLTSSAAVEAFGRKVQALEWGCRPKDRMAPARLQPQEWLDALARGDVHKGPWLEGWFHSPSDCTYAYVLDLDAGVVELWDLVEGDRVVSIAVPSPGTGAQDRIPGERTPPAPLLHSSLPAGSAGRTGKERP